MSNCNSLEIYTLFYSKQCNKTKKILELILENDYKVAITECKTENIDSNLCINDDQPEKVLLNNIVIDKCCVKTPAIFYDNGHGVRNIYSGDNALMWINCHFRSIDELKIDLGYIKLLEESINKNIILKQEKEPRKHKLNSVNLVICNDELSKILIRDALVKETLIRNSKENIATDVIYISHNAVNVTEKTIYSNSYSYIDNSYMDKISLNLENGFNTIIVIDTENMNMNNENIEELTFNGRHYNCTIIFLTVSIPNLSPTMRSNIDYVYVDRGINPPQDELKTLYQQYFWIYESLNKFTRQYKRTVKKSDDYIVIINNSSSLKPYKNISKYRPFISKKK